MFEVGDVVLYGTLVGVVCADSPLAIKAYGEKTYEVNDTDLVLVQSYSSVIGLFEKGVTEYVKR